MEMHSSFINYVAFGAIEKYRNLERMFELFKEMSWFKLLKAAV